MAEEEVPPQDENNQENPETDETVSPNVQSVQDALNTEFVFYSAVLKILGPTLSNDHLRHVTREWIKKLFRPEYQSSRLKEKRNKLLASLCIAILLDESLGIFRHVPPEGSLPELGTLEEILYPAAEWELETVWQDTLQGLPNNFQMLQCSTHATPEQCSVDHKIDKILDQEFQLMLYLARPFASLLTNGPDKTKVAAWLQILCSIHGRSCCSSMKAIRNDYIMALLGYLQDLRVVGPFSDYPSWNRLKPLIQKSRETYENKPLTDPTGPEANEFLFDQPIPEDGAFCYIAITGDLIKSSIGQQ